MKEFDVHDELASIRDKISRATSLKKEILGKPADARDRLFANIFGEAPVVRSEFPADSEELTITLRKVGEIREHIFKNGRDFTQHPAYSHLNLGLFTPEEIDHYRDEFWISVGDFEVTYESASKFDLDIPGISSDQVMTYYTSPFEVHADRFLWEDDETPMGAMLRGSVVDNDCFVQFKFGFDNTYLLEIDFFEDDNWDKTRSHYSSPSDLRFSVDAPINEMTQQEAKIIQHYLGRFWQPQITPPQSKN